MKGVLLLIFLATSLNLISRAQTVYSNALPPNDVLIRELAKMAREIRNEAKWGPPETNGIQLGVDVYIKDDTKARKFGASVYLYDTNICFGLLYPPNGFRIDMSLKGPDGRDAKKTKTGTAVTKKAGVLLKQKLLGRAELNMENRPHSLVTNEPLRYESFNLMDCFNVEKPGTNTLTVDATIYKLKPGGGVFEIALPSTSIQVPITQADLDAYRESKKDGK